MQTGILAILFWVLLELVNLKNWIFIPIFYNFLLF